MHSVFYRLYIYFNIIDKLTKPKSRRPNVITFARDLVLGSDMACPFNMCASSRYEFKLKSVHLTSACIVPALPTTDKITLPHRKSF